MARGYLGNIGRYLVYRGRGVRATMGRDSMPIAGLYARGFDAAEKLAEELFAEPVTVDRYKIKSGWRDTGGLFLTMSTSRGCKYLCKACGMHHLGLGTGNHKNWCTHYPMGR